MIGISPPISRFRPMPIDPAYRTRRGLTDEMRAALAKQGNVVLATISDDGSPHLTEVLFLLDELDRVQMPTPHTTRKFRNLRERPIATAFFYDMAGWISATGTVELWTGEQAAEANQRNRDRLLTGAGHATVGRLLGAREDSTIVLTPEKWLSWSSAAMAPAIAELGGDLEEHPPDTWWRDLDGETAE